MWGSRGPILVLEFFKKESHVISSLIPVSGNKQGSSTSPSTILHYNGDKGQNWTFMSHSRASIVMVSTKCSICKVQKHNSNSTCIALNLFTCKDQLSNLSKFSDMFENLCELAVQFQVLTTDLFSRYTITLIF